MKCDLIIVKFLYFSLGNGLFNETISLKFNYQFSFVKVVTSPRHELKGIKTLHEPWNKIQYFFFYGWLLWILIVDNLSLVQGIRMLFPNPVAAHWSWSLPKGGMSYMLRWPLMVKIKFLFSLGCIESIFSFSNSCMNLKPFRRSQVDDLILRTDSM